ncbi:MAG: sensor domain-containing diguanylate cyclase [Xanthomonadales bacterium]|jgi:diguanylate cyclase (GGDEF)-like protein/PAS domain S-box-containing protein|nr:sensor domain-containing diguanylate cyclase [Xanthomonadales bacterium]
MTVAFPRSFLILCAASLLAVLGPLCVWAADAESGATMRQGRQHALEILALTDPDAALRGVEAALPQAQAAGEFRTIALLELARANACRVRADWACQLRAGSVAREAAGRAGERLLEVRGLIAEARGRNAIGDSSRAQRLLTDAEQLLELQPDGELKADVMLAWSSISAAVGKHALALEYAERGRAELGPEDSPPMQVRLLRNQARAHAMLGDTRAALQDLQQAIWLLGRFTDPKLAAEIHLERARIGRGIQDVPLQRESGERVLALGRQLKNTQLDGMGEETLALADLTERRTDAAIERLERARDHFSRLELVRDELRVLRILVGLRLDTGGNPATLTPLLRRMMQIEQQVSMADRDQAAADFEERLRYARAEAEVARLQTEGELAAEREKRRIEAERFSYRLTAFAVLLAALLGGLLFLQRRNHRQVRQALEKLQASEAKLRTLVELAPGYLLVHDLHGELQLVNPANAEALGAKPEDMIGKSLAEWFTDTGTDRIGAYLDQLRTHGRAEGVLSFRGKDSLRRHWRFVANRSGDAVIASAHDVSIEVEQAEHLTTDALTGARNRRYLPRFAALRGEGPWTAIYFDLVGFKQINDQRGHEAGDLVLRAFVQYLRGMAREQDAVIRIGGDEFVLLVAADADAGQRLLQRLHAEASASPCAFSTGMASRLPAETLEETIARADQAMYAGRQRERQR